MRLASEKRPSYVLIALASVGLIPDIFLSVEMLRGVTSSFMLAQTLASGAPPPRLGTSKHVRPAPSHTSRALAIFRVVDAWTKASSVTTNPLNVDILATRMTYHCQRGRLEIPGKNVLFNGMMRP